MPVTKVKSRWESGNLNFYSHDNTKLLGMDGTNNVLDALVSDPELVQAIGAAVTEALRTGRTLGLELEKWQQQRLQRGTAVLENKFVIAGGEVEPSGNARFVQLTRTGTFVADNFSEFYLNGETIFVPDNETDHSVPINEGGEEETWYAYIAWDESAEAYMLHISGEVPMEGLKLYRITVPAGDTANNLNAVTFTDERVFESGDGTFRDSAPFVLVGIPGFPMIEAPDYDVLLTVEAATDMDKVGRLEAYDKQNNGFKVRMTGSADNVEIRYTIVAPGLK